MDPTCEFPAHRARVADIVFPRIEAEPRGSAETVVIVDPSTRRPILPPVPKASAEQVQDAFDRLEERATEEIGGLRLAVFGLRTGCMDAGAVAGDLRALVYLFEKALSDDGQDTLLTAASHVVIDCLGTVAARLEAIEAAAAQTSSLVERER